MAPHLEVSAAIELFALQPSLVSQRAMFQALDRHFVEPERLRIRAGDHPTIAFRISQLTRKWRFMRQKGLVQKSNTRGSASHVVALGDPFPYSGEPEGYNDDENCCHGKAFPPETGP